MTVKGKITYNDGDVSEVEGDFVIIISVTEPEYDLDSNNDIGIGFARTSSLTGGVLSPVGAALVLSEVFNRLTSKREEVTEEYLYKLMKEINKNAEILKEE